MFYFRWLHQPWLDWAACEGTPGWTQNYRTVAYIKQKFVILILMNLGSKQFAVGGDLCWMKFSSRGPSTTFFSHPRSVASSLLSEMGLQPPQ